MDPGVGRSEVEEQQANSCERFVLLHTECILASKERELEDLVLRLSEVSGKVASKTALGWPALPALHAPPQHGCSTP